MPVPNGVLLLTMLLLLLLGRQKAQAAAVGLVGGATLRAMRARCERWNHSYAVSTTTAACGSGAEEKEEEYVATGILQCCSIQRALDALTACFPAMQQRCTRSLCQVLSK